MKRIFFILVTLTLSLSAMAQSHTNGGSQSTERKQQLAMLTDRYIQTFGLSGQMANDFRALFLDYNKQLQAIKKQYAHCPAANGVPTEEEQDATIRARFARQRAILDIRMTYYDKMRTILSPSQIQRIYDDEKARMENMK